MYEVKATVKSFREAAAVAGVPVDYVEVEGGGHNWMGDADTEASRAALERAIEFLEKRL